MFASPTPIFPAPAGGMLSPRSTNTRAISLAVHLTDSYSAQEASFALDLARIEAEDIHGLLKKRPFLVTDNGCSSFIAKRFLSHIDEDYSHVRIQYRTPTQVGLLEPLHQTLKDGEVYWRLYDNVPHAKQCLDEFHRRYNGDRPHWTLTPEQGGVPTDPSAGLPPRNGHQAGQGGRPGLVPGQGRARQAIQKAA